jgi:hypothetical protein
MNQAIITTMIARARKKLITVRIAEHLAFAGILSDMAVLLEFP